MRTERERVDHRDFLRREFFELLREMQRSAAGRWTGRRPREWFRRAVGAALAMWSVEDECGW